MPTLALCLLLLSELLFAGALAAQEATDSEANIFCTFDDQSQIRIRYKTIPAKSVRDLPAGKVWAPRDTPVTLFTETPLIANRVELPVGAYSMYLIPGKDWTVVVNKNVTAGAAYDEKQDLVRMPMQTIKMDRPAEFSLALGHMAKKVCELRLYYGRAAAWATFTQK
jgi:hypothetical protein